MKMETVGSRVMIYRLILITNRQAVTLQNDETFREKDEF